MPRGDRSKASSVKGKATTVGNYTWVTKSTSRNSHEMRTLTGPVRLVHGTHLNGLVSQVGSLGILKATQNKHDLLHQHMERLL